jgi:hypothetical protein
MSTPGIVFMGTFGVIQGTFSVIQVTFNVFYCALEHSGQRNLMQDSETTIVCRTVNSAATHGDTSHLLACYIRNAQSFQIP